MGEPRAQIYKIAEFRIDASRRKLTGLGDIPLPLTSKVFDTLVYLVERRGETVEKDELMSAVWPDTIVEENNLTQNISALRRLFGERAGENRFIATVPGRGYKFVAEVEVEHEVVEPLEIATEPEKVKIGYSSKIIYTSLAFLCIAALASALYIYRQSEHRSPNANAINSIAVLPFKPLIPDNRNETLELGMADTLINKLGASGNVIVRPLSSVRRFGRMEQDAAAAGRELGVGSVLEGTIQSDGDRLRISARLIRSADGQQLWTETFDERLTDIFSVQDSISERVLTALSFTLSGEERRRIMRQDTDNIEAYQFYMKGRFHAARLTVSEMTKAIEYYQQASELDPNYALVYVGMAQTYSGFVLAGGLPAADMMPKAKAAATRALEVDPELPESHVAAGLVDFWYTWDWRAAEARYQRALALDPNNAQALHFYAHLHSNLGQHGEAIPMIRRSREIDPLSLLTNSIEGQILFFGGQSDEAVLRLEKTLEMEPNFWLAHSLLSGIYMQAGNHAESIASAEKAVQISPGNSLALAVLGQAIGASGDVEGAKRVLGQLLKQSNESYVPAYNVAIVYAAMGENQAALDTLEKAFIDKNVGMTFLKIDPKWISLRTEPRFVDLLRRMNL